MLSTARNDLQRAEESKFLRTVIEKNHIEYIIMLSTKGRNAEILSGGFNDHLSLQNVLIVHEFLTAGYLVFWTTVPVSRGSYSMPKPRELIHNKGETSFRIASHF